MMVRLHNWCVWRRIAALIVLHFYCNRLLILHTKENVCSFFLCKLSLILHKTFISNSYSCFLARKIEKELKMKISPASKRLPSKYKKARDAPKHFKSAFILFSSEKHRQINRKLKQEGKVKKVRKEKTNQTSEVANFISYKCYTCDG